jgi:TonB family protein
MKRIALTAFYVTITSALTVAQLPSPSLPSVPKYPAIGSDSHVLTSSGQLSDEFAPLNNMPFFPGGQRALETYLEDLDVYPYLARQIQIEGTVRVRFRVLPNGCLTDVQVVQSHGALLDQAAIRAVLYMPRWYPAHRAGVAVASPVELLITFRLN